MFLIQFDGCNRDLLGISSIGFVLYYENQVIWKYNSLLNESFNSNYVEYKALIEALKFAININIKYLYVEGDAKIVIDQINNICKTNSDKVIPLLNEVNNLKNKFKYINFQHIYRKNNIYADSLANDALNGNLILYQQI